MQARSISPDLGSSTHRLAPTAAPKQRVLFVDDEPDILDGLRSVLRPQRHEWDMVFALGGLAGLAEIEASKFDVVVTDMRMPILDGAGLLTRVRELQPQAVRLVLSGQTDAQMALQSAFTAHQFLAKPCDPERLRGVVKRCGELSELLGAEELKALAGDVGMLPSAPSTYSAISQALADPNSSIHDAARIVEREPALCAKLLQLANSAFFGLPRAVSNVSQAVTFLGSLALRDLAMEVLAARPRPGTISPATHRAFQLNSLAVALLARRWFAGDRRKAEQAFAAGMLRDLGHLLLAARPSPGGTDLEQHAALSAYLLGLWGIPHAVLEAVAFHEQPSRVEHETLEVMDVVHLCDAVVGRRSPSPFQAPPALDTVRLERLGVDATRLSELDAEAEQARCEAEKMLSP